MANAVLLPKFTATKHPATVQSRFLHQIHRLPPSFNLRFTPHLHLSRSSLKITAFKTPSMLKPAKSSSVDIQFQPMNHEADASPIWVKKVDAILKPLKKCAIALVIVIMAVGLMSYPLSAWARCPPTAWLRRPSSQPSLQTHTWTLAEEVFAMVLLFCVIWTELVYELVFALFNGSAASALKQIYSDFRQAVKNWNSTSVLKLQVGLLGTASSLQRELKLIAEIPCTSTHTVESRVLTETTRALLCHPEYYISAYSCVHVKRSIKGCDKMFDQLSIEERAKFNEKTLVNVNNIRRHHPTNLRAGGCNNDYIVVTILVVARGDHNIPSIKGSTDLKNALQKLESIPPSKIRALKVLWTPQAENKTLSERTS